MSNWLLFASTDGVVLVAGSNHTSILLLAPSVGIGMGNIAHYSVVKVREHTQRHTGDAYRVAGQVIRMALTMQANWRTGG